MKYFRLIVRNVARNPLRSLLTSLVTIVLVFVVTMVWSVLWLLDLVTAERSENFTAMVAERWSVPSRMPYAYAGPVSRGAARGPDDVVPKDSMTWQFYVGTLDPEKLTRENLVFAIACEPEKIETMMDGLNDLPADQQNQLHEDIAKLKANRRGIILGHNHLRAINKQVGERFKLTGMSISKGLDLEFEIVGAFPAGRYDTMAAFNRDYYVDSMDAYPRTHNGQKHPWSERNLSLMLLRVKDSQDFTRVAGQLERSPELTSPAVRCETMSSGISAMLEPYRDLIWGVRWLLAPACLATILLVIANAISISVRERRRELAVLKVLGFWPYQVLILVLGESLLLGIGAGFISAGLTYAGINWGLGGVSFPVGFLDRFFVPPGALWWGPAVGGVAALLGSLLPAWTARNIKAAEVFAKVA
ncbi:MAG: ABC transporter permease [Thermoguttaceae bacterium]